ncbi:nitroreductase family protein [Allokutzneria albata]|nr:nitroreductase family protein [Allokutzneria albata]
MAATEFWERMSVRAPGAEPPGYRPTGTGLRHALAALETAAAVPSAGAIRPCENYVITTEADGLAAFHVDPARRRCARVAVPHSVTLAAAAAGLPVIPESGAHVVVVVRPWLSMRKYGDRGYLYAQLDAAHLATNLLGVAGEFGDAELRLRINRGPLAVLLGLAESCREAHSVVTLRPSGRVVTGVLAGWTVVDERQAGRGARVTPLEAACWAQLAPLLDEGWTGPSSPVRADTVVAPHERIRVSVPFGVGATWSRASRTRFSSKGFLRETVPADLVADALSAIQVLLPTDLPAQPGLHVSMLVRRVAGLRPGTYRLTGTGKRRLVGTLSDALVARLCMGQNHIGAASAVVLLHTARGDLVDSRRLLREQVFRAGATAQLLYLGAATAGIGITAVGGFDSAQWAHAARLPGDQEVLYVLALGADDETAPKLDRFSSAYAHNES